jgi:hypothetical protein
MSNHLEEGMQRYAPESGVVVEKIDDAVEIVQRVCPEAWRRIYTKHIDGPGNYMGYKAVALALVGTVTTAMRAALNKQGESNGAIIAGVLERYNFPVYHVSESLFQSMARTHPPAGMTWNDMHWPFDGLIFMVPRGTLYEPESIGGGEIFMMGVVRLMANEELLIPGTKIGVRAMAEDRIMVFWSIKPFGLTMQDTCFPATQALEPDASWMDARTIMREPDLGALAPGDFASMMAGMVANFMLVMRARPELVEKGRRTEKRLASGVVIHTPTFLGRHYQIMRRAAGPVTGAHFTELRWRAGHFRRQHYGSGGVAVKEVLIDPYIAYGAGLVRPEQVEQVRSESK